MTAEAIAIVGAAVTGPYRLPAPEFEREPPPAEPAPARQAAQT